MLDQATIDFVNQLSKSNIYELHLLGDQKSLNTFSDTQTFVYTTVKQVSQYTDIMIYFEPLGLNDKIPERHLKIMNIMVLVKRGRSTTTSTYNYPVFN